MYASSASARLRSVMSEFSSMIASGCPSASRASAWRLETTITVAVLARVAQLARPPSLARERLVDRLLGLREHGRQQLMGDAADRLRTAVAVDRLRLAVPERHPTLDRITHDHRVVRQIQQLGPQPQLLLGLPQLGHVLQGSAIAAGLVWVRARDRMHRSHPPITRPQSVVKFEPLAALEHSRVRALHALQVIGVYPGEGLLGADWPAGRIATIDLIHPRRPRSRPRCRIPVPRSQLRDLLRLLQLSERPFALLLGLPAVGDVAHRHHEVLTHRGDHGVEHPGGERRALPRRRKLHLVGPAGSPVKATRR